MAQAIRNASDWGVKRRRAAGNTTSRLVSNLAWCHISLGVRTGSVPPRDGAREGGAEARAHHHVVRCDSHVELAGVAQHLPATAHSRSVSARADAYLPERTLSQSSQNTLCQHTLHIHQLEQAQP